MVKSISAKIKDACYQVYESTNITEQPEYQKRNIRHHSRIADTFFSLLLELFDMVFCCFLFSCKVSFIVLMKITSFSFVFSIIPQFPPNFNMGKEAF
ncbi:unknown [Ruminococcus sp. CAG:330]|nr:unknown [Ruminococcus sp. CAG:330]